MVHERSASSSRHFKVFGSFASQWRRPSKGNMANCEDAPACRRRHYACNSSKGYRRGRNMKDRMDEIRSTRAPTLREDQIEILRLYGQAMFLTAVVREGGEVLAITRERLKEIVTEEPNLSDVILRAFLARRTYMIRTGLGLRIIGSRHSSDA